MKLFFAAPLRGLPSEPTAFGSHASRLHFVMKPFFAAPARARPGGSLFALLRRSYKGSQHPAAQQSLAVPRCAILSVGSAGGADDAEGDSQWICLAALVLSSLEHSG
jgi:hypothetical protein